MTANCISRGAAGISDRVAGDSWLARMNRATWPEPGSHHKTATRDRGSGKPRPEANLQSTILNLEWFARPLAANGRT